MAQPNPPHHTKDNLTNRIGTALFHLQLVLRGTDKFYHLSLSHSLALLM